MGEGLTRAMPRCLLNFAYQRRRDETPYATFFSTATNFVSGFKAAIRMGS